ncbi:MAG: thiosulfate oxidation carrier complex protein SoxZ [Methylococcaceae bacterium]|nr:thiosulfate oxidation carrier complex protein SoxZ [Methylococcaceae bacterium]
MSTIKIRTKRLDGKTQIRTLISHPMEHGRNMDEKTGELIPAHYIQELLVKHNDNIIVNSNLGAGISKNPYFAFMLKGGEVGDKITISWRDNLDNSDSQSREIE